MIGAMFLLRLNVLLDSSKPLASNKVGRSASQAFLKVFFGKIEGLQGSGGRAHLGLMSGSSSS